jgi:hypothetical protein
MVSLSESQGRDEAVGMGKVLERNDGEDDSTKTESR